MIFRHYGTGFGVLLTLISIISTNSGAAQAKILFSLAGTPLTIAARLLFGTIMLFIFLRPWRHVPTRKEWKSVALYGLSIAIMNSTFYHAIERIPLGIAVSVELSGPLAVAVLSSRRWQDFAGVALAVIGILLIMPWSGFDSNLDMAGIAFALLAAFFWGTYIIFGRKTGSKMDSSAVAWGMLTGTAFVLPWALYAGNVYLLDAELLKKALPMALIVGTFASALPFWLELKALRILQPQTFGVLMSLEPAAAALSGFLFLGETLLLRQAAATALIMTASVVVTLGARRS